jgi:hypothetical protein
MLSSKDAGYPKFLVLGCNDFEIVDKAHSLTEATIRAQQEDACFVLKILRAKEGVSLGVFDIEEVAVPVFGRRPVPVPIQPEEVLPPPPSVGAEIVEEEVPSVLPVRAPMPSRRRRPPPVELL